MGPMFYSCVKPVLCGWARSFIVSSVFHKEEGQEEETMNKKCVLANLESKHVFTLHLRFDSMMIQVCGQPPSTAMSKHTEGLQLVIFQLKPSWTILKMTRSTTSLLPLAIQRSTPALNIPGLVHCFLQGVETRCQAAGAGAVRRPQDADAGDAHPMG